MWPKLESDETKINLALTNSISETSFDKIEIVYYLIKYLLSNNYYINLVKRYNLDINKENLKNSDIDNDYINEIILEIGKKKGCLISGGNVDLEKTSSLILKDFQSGKLGKISLER